MKNLKLIINCIFDSAVVLSILKFTNVLINIAPKKYPTQIKLDHT